MRKIALAVMFAVTVAELAATQGVWDVHTTTNPLDDSTTVIAGIEASEGVGGFGSDPISLIARCQSNTTEVYITWHDFLGDDELDNVYSDRKRLRGPTGTASTTTRADTDTASPCATPAARCRWSATSRTTAQSASQARPAAGGSRGAQRPLAKLPMCHIGYAGSWRLTSHEPAPTAGVSSPFDTSGTLFCLSSGSPIITATRPAGLSRRGGGWRTARLAGAEWGSRGPRGAAAWGLGRSPI